LLFSSFNLLEKDELDMYELDENLGSFWENLNGID
jgi:hypothetical protein